MVALWFFHILTVICIFSQVSAIKSSLIKGKNSVREVYEGDDALFTCIVTDIGSNRVIWSKIADGKKKILTIDTTRVVQDKRISVLHDDSPIGNRSSYVSSSGDVWVLSIQNVTKEDGGGYVCRVNTSPPVHNFFILIVKEGPSQELEPPEPVPHNYTSCCADLGVDEKCIGFCQISNILNGSTGISPESCESEFPNIVRCMADLRDHTPCCDRQNIPDICQDLCRGEYTVQDDFVQSQFSCAAYTEATLICISEGMEILPRAPESPSAIPVDATSIQVEWSIPANSPNIDHFNINVTNIKQFDPPFDMFIPHSDSDPLPYPQPKMMTIRVPGNATSFKLEKLSPLTWYEISMTSLNKYGSSLTPYRIRVLTKSQKVAAEVVHPKLPDVNGCCRDKGIRHDKCLQTLCNPNQRYIKEPDLIVCAAWAQEAFTCLIGDEDHTPCCQEKGLPDKCVQLCSGNITNIDYTYFQCVDYYSDYRSCLLKGYGVLPGTPLDVTVSNIHSTYALLSWRANPHNEKSITSYHAYFRPIEPNLSCSQKLDRSETEYEGVHASVAPSILENLCPDTIYEVYIQAFNVHGISDPSSRVVFRTETELEDNYKPAPFNVTACCQQIQVSPGCIPMCDYNPKMSIIRKIYRKCRPEMPSVLKCIAGGRDHRPCCERRGVPEKCHSICTGAFHGIETMDGSCVQYIGNIMLCLEEGIGIIPEPIRGLHATQVLNGNVTLTWEPSKEKIDTYQVHYEQIDPKMANHHVSFKLNNTVNVSDPIAVIKLPKKEVYSIFVTAMNVAGSSLPSAVLTVNMSEDGSKPIAGVPSAPHSLQLETKSSTELTVIFQPPAVSLPTDRFQYEIYYARITPNVNTSLNYNVSKSGAGVVTLKGLEPNSQYMIYVKAQNDMGMSRPSESLIAWTDPAYPAFVEPPTVHPSVIHEGGTMTILCIAMGSPPPTVSLYISGQKIHEDVTRHMVTIVKNVSRDMTDIACYADNGYGAPMQSIISIPISHRPVIHAKTIIRAETGQEVMLECHVSGWPQPNMVWWTDPEKRVSVIHGGNFTLNTIPVKKGAYIMQLTIKHATDKDYFCSASNPLGNYQSTVKLRVFKEVKMTLNVTVCCQKSNISQSCIDACEFNQVNYHEIMNRDECFPDFEKFLQCGADGSDHRGCCARSGMPPICLDWCRGRIVPDVRFHKLCLFQWTPTVFKCFQEGQEKLPGPPVNIKISTLSTSSARIAWDKPVKNPEKVELYRVFWRANGTLYPFKSDTTENHIEVSNLMEGYKYEVAVKAGNVYGTSILSETKEFTHIAPYISSNMIVPSYTGSHTSDSQSPQVYNSQLGLGFGIFFSIVFIIVGVISVWWIVKRRPLLLKRNSGVSFDNPSYSREQSGDCVQIAETPNGSLNTTIVPSASNGSGEINNGEVWNVPMNTPGFESDINAKGGYTRFKS